MSNFSLLNNEDFSFIQNLIYEKAGIVIGDHKKEMIFRRLSKRMRSLSINEVSDYCDVLKENNENEMINFINAITTNLTSFFREKHHFDFLENEFFPNFNNLMSKRLRIWSSACSTGEEPYSLAITMLNAFGSKIDNFDAKILATDLDTDVLNKARSGLYRADKVQELPGKIKSQWFSNNGSSYTIDEKLKRYITFNRLNLLGEWPMKGKFDVIFCRNVLIYFDKPTQANLVKRFYDFLLPGGFLMLGHSESILKTTNIFERLGKTIYRKI